jgi:hypothetical protein
MNARRFAAAALAVVGVLSLSACKQIKDGVDAITPTTTIAGQTPTPGTGDPTAQGASCQAERQLVESAVEAYYALEGSLPPNEAALVPNYLHTESVSLDIDDKGNVIPAPGSGC